MNYFLKIQEEHNREIERMAGVQTITPYHETSSTGISRSFSAKISVDLLAKLDVIKSCGLWGSKQHVVYDMVNSAVYDFYENSSQDIKDLLDKAGKDALDSVSDEDRAIAIYKNAPNSVKKDMTEKEFIKSFIESLAS